MPDIGASIGAFSNEENYSRIVQLREAVVREALQDPKIAEFDLLGSEQPIIGSDGPREPLFAETLQGVDLDQCKTTAGETLLQAVVSVHRLRAVTCLYGFTRLEPAPTFTEQLLEDVRLAVDGAPLPETADWLPAMEQLGEGVFLKIRPESIRQWLQSSPVTQSTARSH